MVFKMFYKKKYINTECIKYECIKYDARTRVSYTIFGTRVYVTISYDRIIFYKSFKNTPGNILKLLFIRTKRIF